MSHVIVAGAGHAAGQLVASLKQKKYPGRITLIGDEPWYPYQRPPLSKKFLAGELPAERLYFKPASFYDDPNIEVLLGTRVLAVDRAGKAVEIENGDRLEYGTLVLATGSRVRRLPLAGSELAGVHYLRGIDDVNGLRPDLDGSRRVVIIGAGYIGLEVAAVARSLGNVVTVVEMEERVMSRVVSPQVSTFYQDVHREHGVTIMLAAGVQRIVGEERVSGIELADGRILEADSVVIGIGILPNVELAADAGLEVDDGVLVDDRCRTGDTAIFAIGDCTRHPNAILGRNLRLESVHNALEQAKTAAANICGEDVIYAQVPWFWSDQFDLKLQIAGLSQGYDQVVIRGEPASRSFSCLYLKDGVLIAVDAVNKPKDFMQSKALISIHARIEPALLADGDVELKDMV
jgi:3-phenylpropionate/trans-cinnamate dioxygenase ferredoxin reductase subunit